MKNSILFLFHLPPPVHGSSIVGLSIKESSKINKNFECVYINLLASKSIAETGKINFRKLLGFVVTWFKVFSSLIIRRPQICYLALTSSGAAFYKDLLLVTLLKVFRIKRIYHLHNKGVSLNQYKTINRICYRFVFSGAEVILLSEHLFDDVKQFVPVSKMHICPNGIADKWQITELSEAKSLISRTATIWDERSDTRIKKQSVKKNIQILFLSNLIKSKGVFILLEACALLKKKEIAFECFFIGGEGDVTAIQFYEQVYQLGLTELIHYHGKKYGEEKNEEFSKADIFAFPTYTDCFPLVLLEAMSYSLPIISTFEGGIPDIVEDGRTGFLVPQQDVVALADKLELLIQNSELRHKMGAAGRKKYEQEFTIEIFENRLTEIIQHVIDKK